jgi:hypothetical protein
MQPADGHDRAMLRHRGRDIPVQMLDESAGGFEFLPAKVLRIATGDTVRIKTPAGWHEVQVVHHEETPEGFLVGVERLADVADAREFAETAPRWRDYFFLPWQGNQKEGSAVNWGAVGAGIGLIAAILLATHLFGQYKPPAKTAELIPGSREFVQSIQQGRIPGVKPSVGN